MVHIEIRAFVNIKKLHPLKNRNCSPTFHFLYCKYFSIIKVGFLLLFLSKTTNILITQDKHEIMPKSCNLIHIIYIYATPSRRLFSNVISHTRTSQYHSGGMMHVTITHSKISFGGFKGRGRICGSICL